MLILPRRQFARSSSPSRSKSVKSKFCDFSLFRQRFGLFSQPMSLSVGETNYFQKKKGKNQALEIIFQFLAQKDEDGNVKTAPKNFVTTGVKKGAVDGVLFSKPSYISSGKLSF